MLDMDKVGFAFRTIIGMSPRIADEQIIALMVRQGDDPVHVVVATYLFDHMLGEPDHIPYEDFEAATKAVMDLYDTPEAEAFRERLVEIQREHFDKWVTKNPEDPDEDLLDPTEDYN